MLKLIIRMLKLFSALLLTMFKYSVHNYFDGPTNLFLDLYLTKFLDTSAKLQFFS